MAGTLPPRLARKCATLCLLATTACTTVPVESRRWTVVEVGPVEVVSALDDLQTQQRAEDLRRFQSVVTRLTTTTRTASSTPTVVYLFPNAGSIAGFTDRNAAGLFVGRPQANFLVVDASDPGSERNAVVFHEYVHMIMHAESDAIYPAWYEEGFAEFMSTVDFAAGEVLLGRIPRDRAATLVNGSWLPLVTVLRWDGTPAKDPTVTAGYYAESWALVHFLELGGELGLPDHRDALRMYLQALSRGVGSGKAFRDAFAASVPEIEAQLQSYLQGGRSPYLAYPYTESGPQMSTPRVLSAGEVHRRLAELALELGPASAPLAERLASEATRREPGSARAQLALARALVARDGAAGPVFVRAGALAPADPTIAWFHAHALLAHADASEANLQTVRARLAAAGAANDDSAFAQTLLAREAALRGDREAAVAGLARAWQLDHRLPGVAIELARLYRAGNDDQRSCHILAEVRHRPHLEDAARRTITELSARCATR